MARFERDDEFIEAWLEGGTLRTRRGRTGADDPRPLPDLADRGVPRSGAQDEDDPARATEAEPWLRYLQLQRECLRGGWQRVRDPDREASIDGEPREPALDQALRADPEDRGSSSVYADWLQQRGHPRGALIALQQRGRTVDAELLLRREARVLLGPLAGNPNLTLHWERGFIRAAHIIDWDGMIRADSALRHQGFKCASRFRVSRREEPEDPRELLWELLRHPSGRFLRELKIHSQSDSVAGVPCLLLDVLVRHPSPRPPLSSLVLNLPNWDADLCGVAQAYPDLRELVIAGTRRLELGELKLPRLRRLVIQAAVRRAALTAIIDGDWPELRELALRLSGGRSRNLDGSTPDHYFYSECEYTASDLTPLLDGRVQLPRLRALRLRNAPFVDELCLLLVRSPLAPALEMIDLSGGELTDRGAALLIAARDRFERLREILVEDCRPLSDASRARLRELCKPRRSAARQRSSSA